MLRFTVIHHPNRRQRLSVHELLGQYHWESIDSEYVLGLCEMHTHHLAALEAHPAVLVIPSIYRAETIYAHAHLKNKLPHYISLTRLGITEAHRTADLANIAVQKFGSKFHLDL